MCYDNEGVYVDTYGKITKNVVLQWGELPTSVAYIGTGQIMGWGNKAIEIRYVCLSKTSSLNTNGQIAFAEYLYLMMQEMLRYILFFFQLAISYPSTDRSLDTGHLDGVFMHKRAQKLKFLCERNDKVFFSSVKSGSASQIYFMTLNKPGMAW